jgi:hypothetical protein
MSKVSRAPSVRIAQVVWLASAIFVSVNVVRDLASGWATTITICHKAANCQNDQLNVSTARLLTEHGISVYALSVASAAFTGVLLALWYGLGALVVWRKPEDRGALLCAFFLVVFPSFLNQSIPFVAFFLALILFGLLFPDGHFAPQWTRWLALAAVLASATTILSDGAATLADVVILSVVIPMQIYRFRVISTWDQRQQTKWTVFGLAAAVFGFIGLLFVPVVNGSLLNVLRDDGFAFAISFIPVSIGVSVLRNRLWDIDRIISRALAYTSLSVVLAGIYIGGVIGFQRLFQVFAGGGSPIAIALSTLVIAALFGPLRHRIQVTIDRRFYRAKYDGARAVTAFAHRLRDEVDLAQLSLDMTAVVRETLHPQHVSLWLRDSDRAGLRTPAMPARQAMGDAP